ncbi:aminoglycoside phosphotransferase family protein [Nanoarchaeota archaeon]
MKSWIPKIKKIIESKKSLLGIDEIKSLSISKLGIGENNYNYLVKVNNQKFNFRIALRPEIEKNMKREFDMLHLVPKSLGPKPIYFNNSKKHFPKVFSILTYIEGRHLKRWQDKHITTHAKTLAKIHKKKYSFWGTITHKKKTFDLSKLLEAEIRAYRKPTPKIFQQKDMQLLLPKIRKYVKEHNYLFTSLKKFSLCHTDPCLTNILFHKGQVKYIDWEWISFFDPARDVAQLYYELAPQPPWYMKLDEKRKDLYLNTYLKINPDRTLKERVKTWHMVMRFTDLIFFKWKILVYDKKTSDLPKKTYAKCNKINSEILRKELRNH